MFEFITENWEVLSGGSCLLAGIVFGKVKTRAAKKLLSTVAESLGDRHLSEAEVRKIKKEWEALIR